MSEIIDGTITESYRERRAYPEHKRGGYEEVWEIAYPAVLTMVGQTMLTFVDAVMVGKLGAVQLAGVGLAGTLVWGLFTFFNGLVNGVNTFVAQDFGARRYKNVGKMTWQGMHVALAAGIFLALMSLLSPVFVRLMGPSPEVQQVAASFLRIRLLGGIFMVSWMCFSAFLRGLGDTMTPLKVTLIANAINVVANYCLIFGKFGFPRLGTDGSAIGTVFATGVATVIFVGIFLSKKNAARYATRAHWRPDPRALLRLVRVSAPIGVQWFLDMGGFVVFYAVIGRISTMGLAASEVTLRFMSLSFMPIVGMSIAATTLVGQYIGSKEVRFAVRSGRSAMKLGLVYTAALAILFAVFPDKLIALINSDPEVIRTGTPILRLAAVFQIFDGVGIISAGCLRGAGDTLWTMLVGITYVWGMFVPLAYVGAIVLKRGVLGAWMGITVYIIVLGVTFLLRFRSGKWQKMSI